MVQSISTGGSAESFSLHRRSRRQSSGRRGVNGGVDSQARSQQHNLRGRRQHQQQQQQQQRQAITKQRLLLVVKEMASLREFKQRLADKSARALEQRQLPLYERLCGCLATVRSMLQLFFRYYCLHSGATETSGTNRAA